MSDIYAEKLTRTASEAQRLDEQFELITMNIGYLIHPRIAAALPSRPRVADIGTGTGYFLCRLQESIPDAVLDGYDISSAMYPDQTPENIILKVMDMKQPVPEELCGKYDLVHARMLVAAMLPDEWAGVVRNLCKLLRPGGWMQWGECDFVSCKALRGGGDLQSSPVDTIVEVSSKWREQMLERFQSGWNTLPGDMQAAGLRLAERDCVSSDRLPETRGRSGKNGAVAIFSWLRMMAAKNAPGFKTADELDLDEERVQKELESGAYFRYDIYVTCGQKPLE